LQPIEKKGLVWAGISLLITVAVMALLIVPENAPMRGEGGEIIRSPFMDSLVPIIAIIFFVPGLVYGKGTKQIQNDKVVANKLADTMASVGMFIVLAFTAGQFVALFSETNIGLIIGVYGAEFLKSINLSGIPLLLLFIIIAAFLNLFIGSASAKWAMMAPVLVRVLSQVRYSPELEQMARPLRDASPNISTPSIT